MRLWHEDIAMLAIVPKENEVQTLDSSFIQWYEEGLERARGLVVDRGEEYDGSVSIQEYFPFGHLSHAQMIHTKNLRLMNQLKLNGKGDPEKTIDTILDCINYLAFLYAFIQSTRE
jgi:hypothetical protein